MSAKCGLCQPERGRKAWPGRRILPFVRVGFDLAAVGSVAAALAGPNRDRYLRRVFTAREVATCRGRGGIDPARLAQRFAAKEAVIKVLPAGDGIALSSIETAIDAAGRARVALTGSAADAAAKAGIERLELSLAHAAGAAVALVVAT
jgi:holo-[acyl-carrier protein] synthase